jgi:hypothetical protein
MKSFLVSMRILDSDFTLSLSSIFFILVMVKFALEPMQTELVIALLAAVANYSGKKVIGKMGQSDEAAEATAELATQVTTLTNKLQLMDDRTKGLVGGRR